MVQSLRDLLQDQTFLLLSVLSGTAKRSVHTTEDKEHSTATAAWLPKEVIRSATQANASLLPLAHWRGKQVGEQGAEETKGTV